MIVFWIKVNIIYFANFHAIEINFRPRSQRANRFKFSSQHQTSFHERSIANIIISCYGQQYDQATYGAPKYVFFIVLQAVEIKLGQRYKKNQKFGKKLSA
jgi:hypothetical protein